MHVSRQSDADDGGRHEIARCWNVEVARIPVDDAEDTGKACCLYFLERAAVEAQPQHVSVVFIRSKLLLCL
jgi:hypothetical protein